jgi:hypothetical protein
LDEAGNSAEGMALRRALDHLAAINLGFQVGLDEVRADEWRILVVLAEEKEKLNSDRPMSESNHHLRSRW